MLLPYLAAAWAAGLLLAQKGALSPWQWGLLAALGLLGMLLARSTRPLRFSHMLLLTLCLAGLRGSLHQRALPPDHVAQRNDFPGRLVIHGVVADFPIPTDQGVRLTLQVESMALPDSRVALPASGRVLVSATGQQPWAYGDRLRLVGRLQTPPRFETFAYDEYLARAHIHSVLRASQVSRLSRGQGLMHALNMVRDRALETVYQLFPDPEASLLAGILLGVETGIPDQVMEAFNATGTTHIIAISGFNITIIAAALMLIFHRLLGARRGLLLAGLGIAAYTLLVGADPPVVRAAIMAGLAMTARLLGRQSHGLASLAAASLAMTGVEPHLLWDAGFQLSFASTLGLLLYGQPLQETLAKLLGRFLEKAVAKVILRPASEFFLLTLAAQLTSLPILALHFSRLPLLGLAANLLILPVQPALMILAGLALMAGTLWLPAGQGLAWLAWPAAAYTIRAVEWMASLDLQIHLGPRISAWWVPLYYALLAAATALPSRIRDKFSPLRISTAAATFLLAAMALANGFLWRSLADAPDGRLHLTLLPVKGGAALLVQAPSGRMALINGGKSSIDLSQALGRRMPLTRRSLDWWVELASSDDQIAALEETLPRYPPERALIHSQGEGASHRRVLKSLHTARIPTVPMEPGQTLDLGQGARLQILGLQPQGGYALLSYGRFRFLMAAGEVRPDQELDLTGLTAILLAEKGDLNANPPEWLAALNPALVLLAAGEGDPKSRPDPRLMEHLQGRTLLRTDQHGWIELITDGRQLWIRVERLPLPAEDFPSSARQKRWPPPINP